MNKRRYSHGLGPQLLLRGSSSGKGQVVERRVYVKMWTIVL